MPPEARKRCRSIPISIMSISLVILVVALILQASAAADANHHLVEDEEKLVVCRNLRLDETIFTAPSFPGPPPYRSRSATEEMIIGEDDEQSSTDVSFLLDLSSSPPVFRDSVSLKLQFRSSHPDIVKLLGIDYLTNGTGFQLGGSGGKSDGSERVALDGTHPLVISDEDVGQGYRSLELRIPPEALVHPERAPWTDMRHLAISYGIPSAVNGEAENVQVGIKLMRLCSAEPMPYFCSETSIYHFQEHCHDCECETCHDCGCTEKLPWETCNFTKCGSDQSGCWCSPACTCCSDCEGYSCNCQTCCDTSSLEGCSLGSHFQAIQVEPQDAIASLGSEIIVRGKGFWKNSPNATCRFGDNNNGVLVVSGHVLSETELFCEVPPWDFGSSSSPESINVPVSISLDGLQYTDPTQVSFTYVNCPEGCSSSSCSASVCQCPDHFYGPNCTLKCSDCEHGSCGAVTGTCICDDGWRGPKCDKECPGGYKNPCSGHGTCLVSPDGNNDGDATCFCFEGFWGNACQNDCPKDQADNVCGGKGTCDSDFGYCHCKDGYYGKSCSGICPGLEDNGEGGDICNGRGVCCTGTGASESYSQCDGAAPGSCACNAGRTGESCLDAYCFRDCYNHGSCGLDGTCICDNDYSVQEEDGIVSIEVTRFGKLMDEISVKYETKDLTAKAKEDYTPQSDRLSWSSMDGSKRIINISIAQNDWPEGEESFELILSDPLPRSQCQVGSTGTTLIRIGAKPEIILDAASSSSNVMVARIRFKILRPFYAVKSGEEEGEELKAAFLDACIDAVGAAPDRFYLQGIALATNDTDKVMLTFDILPSADDKEINIQDASSAFVSAVGDPSSPLFSDAMKAKCPIDVSFPPEVHIVHLDGRKSNDSQEGMIILMCTLGFLFLLTVARFIFRHRHGLKEGIQRFLAKHKYQDLRTGGLIDSVLFGQEDDDVSGVVDDTNLGMRYTNTNNSDTLRETFKKTVLQIELT